MYSTIPHRTLHTKQAPKSKPFTNTKLSFTHQAIQGLATSIFRHDMLSCDHLLPTIDHKTEKRSPQKMTHLPTPLRARTGTEKAPFPFFQFCLNLAIWLNQGFPRRPFPFFPRDYQLDVDRTHRNFEKTCPDGLQR